MSTVRLLFFQSSSCTWTEFYFNVSWSSNRCAHRKREHRKHFFGALKKVEEKKRMSDTRKTQKKARKKSLTINCWATGQEPFNCKRQTENKLITTKKSAKIQKKKSYSLRMFRVKEEKTVERRKKNAN